MYTIFNASPNLSHITYNLGSSGDKTFVAKSKKVALLKLKKNVQCPNSRAIPAD
jgi:hypothetical protein